MFCWLEGVGAFGGLGSNASGMRNSSPPTDTFGPPAMKDLLLSRYVVEGRVRPPDDQISRQYFSARRETYLDSDFVAMLGDDYCRNLYRDAVHSLSLKQRAPHAR